MSVVFDDEHIAATHVGRQVLPHGDLAARGGSGTVARQAHEVHLERDGHGLRECGEGVHRTFEHADEQGHPARIILTCLLCRLADLLHNLIMAQQLMVNLVLNVDDSHALHLRTPE